MNFSQEIKRRRLALLLPLHEIESGALDQIKEALKLPFVRKLAIMPDVHQGYTLPIGGVAVLEDVVSPEYVGVDIGCGMLWYDTRIPSGSFSRKELLETYDKIYKNIPVGFNCRDQTLSHKQFFSASGNKNLNKKVNEKLGIQLGTLGGGNHFIEIGEMNGSTIVVVHSGSRNPGHSIAQHYMKLSSKVDVQYPDGFFDCESEHGKAYIQDCNFALEYSFQNRREMLKEILHILGADFDESRVINENHNTVNSLGDNLFIHRKGATPAEKDQFGLIPGNMRDGVYLTQGLGNENYLCSASHGAGRAMSRKKAKKNCDLNHFKHSMGDIIAPVGIKTLDECPDAYKDLDTIIERQKGIVIDVIGKTQPMIVVKG